MLYAFFLLFQICLYLNFLFLKDGLTPLHCSARDGHENCVELLIVHNASLTAKTTVSFRIYLAFPYDLRYTSLAFLSTRKRFGSN